MRTIVVAIALIAMGLTAPTSTHWPGLGSSPAAAYHPELSQPWIWAKLTWGTPPDLSRIDWQPCAMTGPQENIAQGAMFDWPLRLPWQTDVDKVADGCTLDYDLVVAPLDSEDIEEFCTEGHACILLASGNLNGDGRVLVFKAIIRFNSDEWNVLSDPQRKHVFAHEFGHAMSLEHHSSCGQSVMSGYGCSDLVKYGPWPNDVCWPAYNMYYPYWEQVCQ